jgi:hypothetical protein
MTASLLCLCLLPAASPDVVPLLVEDAAYRKAKEPEVFFEGVLQRNNGTGQIGAARFNLYSLLIEGGARTTRELYLPGKGHLLATHVGKRVRLTGKLIETEIDGKKHVEIWPARLEIGSGTLPAAPGADGVFARCIWQPGDAMRLGARSFVFSEGETLAKAMRLTGTSPAESATVQMAKMLHVPAIDWKKHMVVSVCAGLKSPGAMRLAVTKVAVEEDTLVIRYRLEPPMPNPGGFGYPAETVLLERFVGPVRIEMDKSKEPTSK